MTHDALPQLVYQGETRWVINSPDKPLATGGYKSPTVYVQTRSFRQQRGVSQQLGDSCSRQQRGVSQQLGDSCSRQQRGMSQQLGDSCSHQQRGVSQQLGDSCSRQQRGVSQQLGDSCSHQQRGVSQQLGDSCSRQQRGMSQQLGDSCSHQQRGVSQQLGDSCSVLSIVIYHVIMLRQNVWLCHNEESECQQVKPWMAALKQFRHQPTLKLKLNWTI